MGHVHELERERPEIERLPGFDFVQIHLAQLVLVELRARHRGGQRARVDRRGEVGAELAQHPGQRAEMVLVAVRDHDRLDVGDAFAQVGEIGQDQVDPDHLRRGKAQAHVDHDETAVLLDDRHVLADLAEAAERQYAQLSAHAGAPASSPWRSSMSRTASSSSGVAGTSGRRRPPASKPSMFSAAFVHVGFDVRKSVS